MDTQEIPNILNINNLWTELTFNYNDLILRLKYVNTNKQIFNKELNILITEFKNKLKNTIIDCENICYMLDSSNVINGIIESDEIQNSKSSHELENKNKINKRKISV